MPVPKSDPVDLPALVRARPAPGRTALLHAIRCIATGGLHDAHAANTMFATFGLGFRRPLVLLRALMAELARVAQRSIAVGPCCCPRTTPAEARLLGAIAIAVDEPGLAEAELSALAGARHCPAALSAAVALSAACADLGRPVAPY